MVSTQTIGIVSGVLLTIAALVTIIIVIVVKRKSASASNALITNPNNEQTTNNTTKSVDSNGSNISEAVFIETNQQDASPNTNVANTTNSNSVTNTSETSTKPAAPVSNLKCLQNVAKFQDGAAIFTSEYNFSSLTDSTNALKLQLFCEAGKTFYSDNCNLSLVNPQNNVSFRKYCCNDSVNMSDCNDSAATCVSNKAKFVNEAYNITAFNDASLNNVDNLKKMTNFCKLGSDIVNAKCSIDLNYPMNNNEYIKYCCNRSSDPTACSIENLACLSDTGKFLNDDYNFQNFNLSSLTSNAQNVAEYCQAGITMVKSGCTKITNPLNSNTFRKLCCNGSTDIAACENNSVCINNAGFFLTQDYNMQDINPGSNAKAVSDYCASGIELQQNNCSSITIPINSSSFRKLCCNNTSDPAQCNKSGLQCALDSSEFKNKAYSLQGVASNPASIGTNINTVIAFCELGSHLTTDCKSVDPHNDNTYRLLCT